MGSLEDVLNLAGLRAWYFFFLACESFYVVCLVESFLWWLARVHFSHYFNPCWEKREEERAAQTVIKNYVVKTDRACTVNMPGTSGSCSPHWGTSQGILAAAAVGSTGQGLLHSVNKHINKVNGIGKYLHQTFFIISFLTKKISIAILGLCFCKYCRCLVQSVYTDLNPLFFSTLKTFGIVRINWSK